MRLPFSTLFEWQAALPAKTNTNASPSIKQWQAKCMLPLPAHAGSTRYKQNRMGRRLNVRRVAQTLAAQSRLIDWADWAFVRAGLGAPAARFLLAAQLCSLVFINYHILSKNLLLVFPFKRKKYHATVCFTPFAEIFRTRARLFESSDSQLIFTRAFTFLQPRSKRC